MKTSPYIITGLLLIGLIYSFTNKNTTQQNSEETNYVVVSYSPTNNDYDVYYGGTRTDSKKTEKGISTQNSVINLFNQLNAEGYTMVSAITVLTPGKMAPDIRVFFERRK